MDTEAMVDCACLPSWIPAAGVVVVATATAYYSHDYSVATATATATGYHNNIDFDSDVDLPYNCWKEQVVVVVVVD